MAHKLGLKLGTNYGAHGALDLARYVKDSVLPPAQVERTTAMVRYPWGMLGNDEYGDCAVAGMLHGQEVWGLKAGRTPIPWTTNHCLSLYFEVNNVPPGPPGSQSDQGTDPNAMMQYWKNVGLPGHEIAGWATLDPASPHIHRAIWEFGIVLYCMALPLAVQDEGVHWSIKGTGPDWAPGSWGGHLVTGDSYTVDGHLGLISWGQLGDMTPQFLEAYGEMVLVPLSPDALNAVSHDGPAGFNFAKMRSDLPTL